MIIRQRRKEEMITIISEKTKKGIERKASKRTGIKKSCAVSGRESRENTKMKKNQNTKEGRRRQEENTAKTRVCEAEKDNLSQQLVMISCRCQSRVHFVLPSFFQSHSLN